MIVELPKSLVVEAIRDSRNVGLLIDGDEAILVESDEENPDIYWVPRPKQPLIGPFMAERGLNGLSLVFHPADLRPDEWAKEQASLVSAQACIWAAKHPEVTIKLKETK